MGGLVRLGRHRGSPGWECSARVAAGMGDLDSLVSPLDWHTPSYHTVVGPEWKTGYWLLAGAGAW